jgi:hypothetical protein
MPPETPKRMRAIDQDCAWKTLQDGAGAKTYEA